MDRRTFITASGVSLGTIALGSVATATEATDRFLVDRSSLRDEDRLEIVHELAPVDLLVVRSSEDELENQGAEFAPDVRLETDGYRPARRRELESAVAGDEDLSDYQWDKADQGVPEAHDYTRGEGTRVAIIDTGIAAGHPDLEDQVNLELSRNFTDDEYGVGEPYSGSHGTHVAGIVGANDDGTGVVGSAPGTELVDLRVFAANPASADRAELPPSHLGDAFQSSVLAALVYAAEIGCDAANLSLGWTWLMRSEGAGELWGRAHQRVGTYARRQGTLHTHASGNWGESIQFNQDETDSSETAGGITTSSTGPIGFAPDTGEYDAPPYTPSTYTTHGVGAIDLAAPGGQGGEYDHDDVLNAIAVPEFDDDGEYQGAEYGYDWLAGTSMAAPQVAGAVALVRSVDERANANQVRTTLERTASVPDEYERKYYGRGYLDTLAAVEDTAGPGRS
ncbi:S8 family serine peptidase [Natronococcus sp. A-GB1]|uniref:S8 family peptidase n=1 Tax=Natronococcus sp. A-GB1 TaxID=3037648 RepID=UPI00241C6A81|nr:S8 family serine peptidase [Natronococcus sp. A-GB1]MDG5758624.1 S8 family serine peptidase [Natronococcus sp. A-GB1]